MLTHGSVVSSGVIMSAGDITTGGEVISSGQLRSYRVTELGTTSTEVLNLSLGQVFTLSTARDVSIIPTNMTAGAQVFLIVTGGGAHTVTFGISMKGLSNLAVTSGQVFTLHFICNGSSLYEVSRTAAFTDTV